MGFDMNRRGLLIGLMSTAAVGAIACAVAAPAMAVSEPSPEPVPNKWPGHESEMWEFDTKTIKYRMAWKIDEAAWERCFTKQCATMLAS